MYLPHNMNKAGRVDFVLEKVGLLPSVLSITTDIRYFLHLPTFIFCVRGSVFFKPKVNRPHGVSYMRHSTAKHSS